MVNPADKRLDISEGTLNVSSERPRMLATPGGIPRRMSNPLKAPPALLIPDKYKDPIRSASVHAGDFSGIRQGKIADRYKGVQTLGTGGFGTVLCIEDRFGRQKYACKCLSKLNLSEKDHKALQAEIDLLRACDHPNIMKFYSYFEDTNQIYLICELCEGGELFDLITNPSYASTTSREVNAAIIIRQVLSGLAYLHNLNIIHRDIKPENILLKNPGDINTLKIIDLGLGARYSGKPLSEQVGTPYYIAPEILERDYTNKCDIWSAGVLLYVLIAGHAPFWGPDDKTILRRVRETKFSISGHAWSKVSPQAKDLVKRMLAYPEGKRLSAIECLSHPWFQQHRVKTEDSSIDLVISELRKFRGHQKLDQAVRIFLSYHANKDEEIERLTEIFNSVDVDGNKVLDKGEVYEAYLRLEANKHKQNSVDDLSKDVLEKEVDALFNKIDANGDGYVEISEWLAACLEDTYILKRDRLRQAFDFFDADNSGTISADEISKVLHISDKDSLKSLMTKFNKKMNGELTFDEFAEMLSSFGHQVEQ